MRVTLQCEGDMRRITCVGRWHSLPILRRMDLLLGMAAGEPGRWVFVADHEARREIREALREGAGLIERPSFLYAGLPIVASEDRRVL